MLSIKKKRTRESVENFEETYNGDEFFEMYGWIGAPTKILIYGKLNNSRQKSKIK